MAKIANMFRPGNAIDTSCISCKRHEKSKNPFMEVQGQGRMGILIITESPDKHEDSDSQYMTGRWGRKFRKLLSSMGLNFDNDFWITSMNQCYTGKEPTNKEISLCSKKLNDTIAKLNPRFIWTIHSTPTKCIVKNALKKVSITSLNGRTIPIHDLDAWCMPLIHHSSVFNRSHDINLHNYYERTIRKMVQFVKKDPELPSVQPFDDITFLETVDDIEDLVNDIIDHDLLSAFDFETTGLEPWVEGHNITTMAICTEKQSYAFAIEHPEAGYSDDEVNDIMDIVCDYLECKNITKIGHNVNFDKMWGYWVLGADPKGVNYCTMNTSHILDHRAGNNSLKDQAFLRYGITNYDSDTDGYIKSVPGTHFNRMMQMPLSKQLLYVGADARLTMKLFLDQRTELTEGQKKAEMFFVNSLETLLDFQNNGLIVNSDYYKKVNDDLGAEINELESKINNSDDAKEYTKRYRKEFKYSSSDVLKKLLFEMRGLEATKFTAKGNASVDEEALGKIDYWMCDDIVKLRKLEKLKGTYIKQYLKGVNGTVHPTFQLHTVTSFRSSCRGPNVQNTPKRNKIAKNLIRKGMKPPKGWKMFEIDVSGCEVSTSAMYHKDPTFMEYLWTPGTDMHKDITCDIWKCEPDQVTKMMRFFGKNMWTFAQFYGDYFGSCAPNLWNTCLNEEELIMEDGCFLLDHINAMGITELGAIENGHCTPGSFLEHCQKVEDKMWNETFPVYTQWKKDINNFYNEHGYVETFLGFRYNGYLDSKQTTNFLVQGTAFHLLMAALTEMNRRKEKEKFSSYLVGEVHDSGIGYVHPDEENDYFKMARDVFEVWVPNRFDFVNVPFKIEVEVSEKDGNFASLTEINLDLL